MQRPSFAERASYDKRMDSVREVFPEGENEGVVYPPTHAEYKDRLVDAPAVNAALQGELFALLQEYEKGGWNVNGRTLYPTQRAHIAWEAAMLAQGRDSPHSLLLHGPAGSGKTLELGINMQALVRLQVKGVLGGNVAFATAKAYHMAGKTVGRNHVLRSMLQAPPYEPSAQYKRSLYRDLEIMFPNEGFGNSSKGFLRANLPLRAWLEQFEQPRDDVAAVRTRLNALMCKHGGRSEAYGPLLEVATALIVGRATTVTGPIEGKKGLKPELLHFPLREEKTDSRADYLGDAAFSVPRNYPVYARNAWMGGGAPTGDPRVILTTANGFTNQNELRKLQGFLPRTDAILLDEARRTNPAVLAAAVRNAGGEIPLVIGATNVVYATPPWDRVSPAWDVMRAVEEGQLPGLRVNQFPSVNEPHFEAESEKAVGQLLEEFFRDVPLAVRQPWNQNTLFVVHSQLTRLVARRLREEYARRKPKTGAHVHCFDAKSGESNSSGRSQKEVLQAWFTQGESSGPKILVSTPSAAADALDLPTLRHLVVGTRVTPDVLRRLIGRALHSDAKSATTEGSVMLTLQQFSDGNPRSTPFGVLSHSPTLSTDEAFLWARGAVLLPTGKFDKEQTILRGKKATNGAKILQTLPSIQTGKRATPIAKESGGMMLVKKEIHSPAAARASGLEVSTTAPPTEEAVEAFLCQNNMNSLIAYRGALTVAAIEAFKKERRWDKAVIARAERLANR